MTKLEMIQALVNDFKAMFPETAYAEVIELRSRLMGFTETELKLLVSQIG